MHERSIALAEQNGKTAVGGAGHGEIRPAVPVEIGDGDFPAAGIIRGGGGKLGRLLEGTVAVAEKDGNSADGSFHRQIRLAVSIQVAGGQRAGYSIADGSLKGSITAAEKQHGAVTFGQIELAIAVEVGRNEVAGGKVGVGPWRQGHAQRLLKGSVAVAEKDGDALRIAHRQVELAVMVEVTGHNRGWGYAVCKGALLKR